MKNLVSLLFATLMIVSISVAQERGPRQNRTPEEMAKMQVERLTEQLTLDKQQQDSIYKYSLLISKEQRELMQNAGDNREAAFKKLQTLRESNDKKIKSFLSKDQLAKYEEYLKNRPQGRPNRTN